MKKFLTTVLTVFIFLGILAGAAAGFYLYRKYAPSKELADQSEWFGVSGDEVAVLLDHELVEAVKGRYMDGEVYLPLSWVNDELNERFYWDDKEKQLIYTLPESIVYADAGTLGNDGKPLLFEQDGEVWLKTGLILTYTDVRIERYVDDEVKRVFVGTSWEPIHVAKAEKKGELRVRGGVKSDILTQLEPEQPLEILDTMEKWSKVKTETGYIGYVQNKILGDIAECEQISTFDAPVYTNIAMNEPVCMVWHQVMTAEANGVMERLIGNTKGVNVIAPTWFMLTDNDGSYESLADQSYVTKAHNLGMQVWAVLDNFNKGSEVRSEILFADSAARKKLIANLMEDVEKYGIDGINLDIEGIKPAAGPHYIQFIRELSVDCRKNGIVLSVDSYVPSAYTSFYNRAEQGRVADYVIIMGYDEHYAGGEAGSVASLEYERKGIEDTLKEVPAQKVISAIPFYTRLWKVDESGETTSTAMGIAKAAAWVEENGMELYWQDELGQYYGEKQMADGMYYLWMEEERSIGLKADLIRKNGLAGVACWKLGFEPAEIWDIVKP